VAGTHGGRLERGLAAAGIAAPLTVLPPGEGTKNWTQLGQVLDDLLDQRPERGDLLLALGGGVIGDLVGVAASLMLRGVDFVQAPTTLLAQVDSSVGGKTGVNTKHGKNLVGAFHQPRLVLADLDALKTLPRRELLAGYAETVKYGLIEDPEFFTWCETNGAALVAGDLAARQYAVAHAIRCKARTVAADEREGGARGLLNLGHTFGHALEAAIGYSDALLHGEAVSIGMVLAFDLSARLGLCPPEDAARVRRHLVSVGLPVNPPSRLGNNGAQLVELMGQDKKVHDGRITFVLARGIGRAFLARDVDTGVVRDVLDRALAA
jgi:3-dehydroquinate synthase